MNYPRLWNVGLFGDKLHNFEKSDVLDAAFQDDFKRLLSEIFSPDLIQTLSKHFYKSKHAAVIYSLMKLKALHRQNCWHMKQVSDKLCCNPDKA